MPIMSPVVDKARVFATAAHSAVDQRRKYTGEPYINHPRIVYELVRSVTDDTATLAAAWLHDVVEDTKVTLEDIRLEFGDEIYALVADLTDVSRPEDGNRAVRKAMDRDHIAGADPKAKTIKLADLIDNTRSIVARDPSFAKVYIREKRALLEVLMEGDNRLFAMAHELLVDAESGL